MAIRKSEVRKLRREIISRKARVWSRLTKSLRSSLNNIAHTWIKELISSTQEVSLPKKFNHELNKILREVLAYGYWLNHIYLQELRAIVNKTKYQSKITLSDTISNEDEIRKALESLMSFCNASEWHDVIPEEAVKWLDGYTPKLSGVFEQAVLEKTRDIIQQSMHEGSTLQERMKALREAAPELEAMSKNRIESIARTEITRADSMGTLISNKSNDDVIGYEFSAIMDDRTTDICALRHGLFMKIDDPRLAENTPPLHVNCLLGDTLVSPIGKVSAYSKRVFNGDVIVIKTAGGNDLSGTPNHPILTSRGWVALCEIHEGDYIVCDTFSERGNIINGEHKQVIACIKDTANAFLDNSKVRATPVPMSAEDFHHDGGNSNVAVIYTDRELSQRGETFSDKQVIKHSFIFRDVICSFLKNCKSVLFFCFNRIRCTSFSVMSFLGKFFSFFRCCMLHTCKLLFMSIARFNTISQEDKFDSARRGDIKFFSNTSNTYTLIMQSDDSFIVNGVNGTFPLNSVFNQNIIDSIKIGSVFFLKSSKCKTRQVIFDKVVFVNKRYFVGHVYNLQTESGIYVANNIITHNCRSMLLACTIYDFPDGLNTSHEFDEPKFPSAMQRPEDIEEIRKIIEDIKVNPVEISKMIEAEFVGTNFVTNGTKVSSLEDLREMASHGEMPQKIEGSREERARLFEEIDKLYERPLYVHDVKIQEYGSTIDIQYLDNYFSGIGGTARCPSGRKASSAEREGVIKHRMYFDRAEMELRIHDMFGGFPTPEMREKYYGRPITDAERASVMAEAERIILKVMGSPLSPAGREQINAGWGKSNVRVG